MSILDNLCEQKMMRKHIDDFRHIDVTQSEPRVMPEALRFAEQNEWELTATVRVNFMANQAQYRDARRIAEQTLLSRMYADIHGPLQEAKQAISDGNRSEAFAAIALIESAIGV